MQIECSMLLHVNQEGDTSGLLLGFWSVRGLQSCSDALLEEKRQGHLDRQGHGQFGHHGFG